MTNCQIFIYVLPNIRFNFAASLQDNPDKRETLIWQHKQRPYRQT